MKPSFALSLSFEGIRLLHRAAGGWRVVGGVGLDDPDMNSALTALRASAEDLAPEAVWSKVLLPNEQVKYLTIDTPDMDLGARRNAAAVALNGATPYAVSDLAFDVSIEGDKTHIAAVARETLAEAESFANQYGFKPVSFAAAPKEEAYLGEPYFGVAPGASALLAPGETVEPDGIAVVVIGDVVPAVPKAPPAPASPPKEAVPEAAQAEFVPPPPPSPPETPPETPSPDAVVDAEMPPTVGFASRRTPERTQSRALGGVTRSDGPDEPAVLGAGAITAGSIAVEPDPPEPALPNDPEPLPEVQSVAAPKTGFLSRRRAQKPPKPAGDVIPAAPPPVDALDPEASSEQERMTIFGARKTDVGGKPRFLGLILTAALLVFLAGVAAWASVFLDDGLRLSRLFGERAPAPTFADAVADDLLKTPQPDAPQTPDIVTASLDPSLSAEDAAVLDALRVPEAAAPAPTLDDGALAARYAATGIWPVAPETPPAPASPLGLDDLYITSVDPVSTAADAIALPQIAAYDTDASLALVSSPAAAGTIFTLDPDGLVIATAQGALSPDGFTVYLGKPPLVPPATPVRFQSEPSDNAIRSALAAARPLPRPADLIEKTERATLGGLTRSELADIRPALRPESLQEQAAAVARKAAEEAAALKAAAAAEQALDDATQQAETEATNGAVALALAAAPQAFEDATRNAVKSSVRPDVRPRNFARIVKRAQRNTQNQEVRVASAAAVAPRVVTPKIPTRTSVAKQATVRNAINLRKINLIGVYGKPSSRRALVRLGNGRYRKVEVGDRIDGGRVSAIGESQLRYNKRGRDVVLKMP